MLLNEGVTVRRAQASDWPAVAALLARSHLPADGAREHLRDFLLAVGNGEVLASAGAEVRGDTALLRSVAVAPGRQRQGIGRALVARVLEHLARRGVGRVFLLTTTAPAWFERMGFRRESREHAPVALQASAEFRGACPDSAVLMAKDLQAASPGRDGRPVAATSGPQEPDGPVSEICRGIQAANWRFACS